MTANLWEYTAPNEWGKRDLTGFKVEASDGSIGKIDSASTDVGSRSIVVDTGPWILGSKVMLPAGVISGVNYDERMVMVNATKQQIKDAPEFDPDNLTDPSYRDKLGDYYGGLFPR